MAIVDPIVLPADVVVVPVGELPDDVREGIDHTGDEYAVTRPRTRTPSSVVDPRTAGLLEAFRTPRTIVDAVIEYSTAEQLDPRDTLEEAFPVLARFLNAGILVSADSDLAAPIETTLAAGSAVGGFEIVEPVHLIVDTEVYLARAPDGTMAALKIARSDAGPRLRAAFDREAAVLRHLDGRVAPEVLDLGDHDGRPFLAVSWCPGVDAHEATAEARERGAGGRGSLLEIAEAIVAAYAGLHARGVLHGDVHPRNVLVDADGSVRLVDFGLAQPGKAGPKVSPVGRGGVDFFLEPELAEEQLGGRAAPPATAAGEQYSVGALLYLVLTGAHTHAFSLEEEAMLRQLAVEPHLPFAAHGVRGLDRVERVLGRMLAKPPSERFSSLEAALAAFREAAAADARSGPERRSPRPRRAASLVDDVVARLALDGPLIDVGLEPPTASVNNGAAGLAYGLLRIAIARESEELLAVADAWSWRAVAAAGTKEGFRNDALEISPEVFGPASLYHSAVGVHLVDALVARARGDEPAEQAAVQAFSASAGRGSEQLDVAFGRSGLLLGCSLLLDAAYSARDAVPAVRSLGDELLQDVWAELTRLPELAACDREPLLGAAHGWAGFLYAVLRWGDAAGGELPAGVRDRLEQLAALAVPAGRGLRWPRGVGEASGANALGGSWCNGAAGLVFLWIAAHRALGDKPYGDLAERAGWTCLEGQQAGGDLCCGLAGSAYALLALHRHTGDRAWLERAHGLAERAADQIRGRSLRRDSLYKGDVGVAVLAAELARPEDARLPLFEGG